MEVQVYRGQCRVDVLLSFSQHHIHITTHNQPLHHSSLSSLTIVHRLSLPISSLRTPKVQIVKMRAGTTILVAALVAKHATAGVIG